MIDITTALYNILHSRYGKDVRQSIHDGISQINDNANEALQNAKTMGVGTAVTSSTSSSTGYVEGNLYLNNSTWDLWKCVGTNSWQNTGNIKGLTGAKGTDGINNFIYIKYSAHYDGTDFTSTPTASSQFIGIYYGQSTTAPTNKQDYQWTSYVGAPGTSAYIYIRYSENPDGSNLVDVPTPLTKYIGFYAGSSASAPAGKQYYTWSEYVGKSGSGSGDMLASEYATSGIVGTVDKAIAADSATSATDATNASNLKKSNGETMSADDVTTKLANFDENGNVVNCETATTNNLFTLTTHFISNQINARAYDDIKAYLTAEYSNFPNGITVSEVTTKGGAPNILILNKEDHYASATIQTYVGKPNTIYTLDSGNAWTDVKTTVNGVVGGDEYLSTKTYSLNDTCIRNNKVYVALGNNFSNVAPPNSTYWKETSLSEIQTSIAKIIPRLNSVSNMSFVMSNVRDGSNFYSNSIYIPQGYTVQATSIPDGYTLTNSGENWFLYSGSDVAGKHVTVTTKIIEK